MVPVMMEEYGATTSNSTVKLQRQANSSVSSSLPDRVYECRCQVIIVQDLLQCGVVQLEGANRKSYCLFFGKDFISKNKQSLSQKLSLEIPIGTFLLVNARLVKEGCAIPFLATSLLEDGAIPGKDQVSNLFSTLDSQEIDQHNRLSGVLEWHLPRVLELNNYNPFLDIVDKHVANGNGNMVDKYHSKFRARSPGYQSSGEKKRRRFHHSRTRSRSPNYYQYRPRSKSPIYQHNRSRSPRYHHYRGRSPRAHHNRSRSPITHPYGARSPRSHPNGARSRSPKYCPSRARSRSPIHHNRGRNGSPHDVQVKEEIKAKKVENPIKNHRETRREGKRDVRTSIDKISTKNIPQDIKCEVNEGCENTKTSPKTNKKLEDEKTISNNTQIESFDELENQDTTQIINGKGKVIRILNGYYGIAMIFDDNRSLERVLFDTYDVYIDSQTCADLGKKLDDIMKIGDFVNLHAIRIENASIDVVDHEKIQYMATAVVYSNTLENLLSIKCSAGPILSHREVKMVSQDKIDNFHQVTKVAIQDAGSLDEANLLKTLKNDGIADKHGVLWKRSNQLIDYFCFHCKIGHDPKRFGKRKMHNTHMKRCKKPDSCLEWGKIKFQEIKQSDKLPGEKEYERLGKEQTNDCGTKILNCSGIEEFRRLYNLDSSGRHGDNYCCFHCQYEGPVTGHFSSKQHNDHIEHCGTKILDCPENPQMSAIVRNLKHNRDLLSFPQWSKSMASSYHRYYCLHCKEAFTDKHHVGQINHSFHMSKKCCQPTCKMVLLKDGKYKSSSGGVAKSCLICNVKFGTKSEYREHVKDSIVHTGNVLNLLRKDGIVDGNLRKTIKCEESFEVVVDK